MESMPKGKREVMGNRWQGMVGLGEVAGSESFPKRDDSARAKLFRTQEPLLWV